MDRNTKNIQQQVSQQQMLQQQTATASSANACPEMRTGTNARGESFSYLPPFEGNLQSIQATTADRFPEVFAEVSVLIALQKAKTLSVEDRRLLGSYFKTTANFFTRIRNEH